jgi:hypothetical protein
MTSTGKLNEDFNSEYKFDKGNMQLLIIRGKSTCEPKENGIHGAQVNYILILRNTVYLMDNEIRWKFRFHEPICTPFWWLIENLMFL